MIHLDSSFLIRSLVPQTLEAVRLERWLNNEVPLGASAVCWAEFLCGPFDVAQVPTLRQMLGVPVPFTERDSVRAAELFNIGGGRRGTFVDCMIAATAIGENATLATMNVADFSRFQSSGLVLEKI
jgi:predicted nucleic acid-binding protein